MQSDSFTTSTELQETAYRKLEVDVEKPNKLIEYISWVGGILLAILFLIWVWMSFPKQ